MKVLENKVVDLDILPGSSQIEAQKLLREQLAQGAQGAEAASNVVQAKASDAAGSAEGGVKKIQVSREQLDGLVGQQLSEEQKDRIMEEQKSLGGMVVDGAGNVVKGLAGTVGGVVKGVGDTGLNTVYALGSGVTNIGTGLAGGLTDTAKAATGQNPKTTTVQPDKLPGAANEEDGEVAGVREGADELSTQARKPKSKAPSRGASDKKGADIIGLETEGGVNKDKD